MTVTRSEALPGPGTVEVRPDPRAARLGTGPYTVFAARVREARRLSPSFLRVTFTGDDLDLFADLGNDQRIKLVLPLPGCGLTYLPSGPDWYPQWRQLDDARRNPIRTYTARQVRAHARQRKPTRTKQRKPAPRPSSQVPARVGAAWGRGTGSTVPRGA